MRELIRERLRLIEEKRGRLKILDTKKDWTPEEISEFHERVVALSRRIDDLDRRSETDGS